PREAVVGLSCVGLRPDRTLLSSAHDTAVDVAVLRFGVDNPRLDIVDGCVEAVAAVNHLPIIIHDAVARERLAWPAPTAVVLQTAADVVRLFVVERYFVELSDGNGVDEVPGLSSVVAPVNAAIGSGEHVIRIGGI